MFDFEWIDGLVHLCVDVYQSATDAGMACGIRLSTWSNPERIEGWPKGKTSSVSEIDLGYTFERDRITCPKCLVEATAFNERVGS